jgi:hypothetical protein
MECEVSVNPLQMGDMEKYRSVILSSQIRLGSFLRVPDGSVG